MSQSLAPAVTNLKTVFVDMPFVARPQGMRARMAGQKHGQKWCHMWCRDVETLHAIAAKIGMKREWFQKKANFPHYDLVPTKRALALELGAIEVDLVGWMKANIFEIGRCDLLPEHAGKAFTQIRWEHFKPEIRERAPFAWKVHFFDDQAECDRTFIHAESKFWILPATDLAAIKTVEPDVTPVH